MLYTVESVVLELLASHACVIIPGFGGLVKNFNPSLYQEGLNRIHPPSASLMFNPHLKTNDGLLVNALAEKNKFAYSEAQVYLEEFVNECNIRLKSGQRLEWDGIGFLFHNSEGSVHFVHDHRNNLLKSSFGLDVLSLKPIVDEVVVKKEVVFEDRKAPDLLPVQPYTKKKFTYSYLLILPLIALTVWGTFQYDRIFNSAGLSKAELYSPINYEIPVLEPSDNQVSLDDSTGLFSLSFKGAEGLKPLLVKIAPVDTTRVDLNRVKTETVNGFGIVVGCFSNLQNAENLVKSLNAAGTSAALAGKTPAGLHRVVYSSYPNRFQAEQQLTHVRSQFAGAWVLKM
jgi:hypothetical protein